MKLLLTSAGIVPEIHNQFIKLLGKNPQGARLVYIPTAADPEPWKGYCQDTAKKISHMGFIVETVDLKGQDQKSLAGIFNKCDVIFVEGGNTFYLLDWVKKSGFDKTVKEFIASGGVYVGVSAGSIIAGPNIEPASWKHADRNFLNLTDLSALNLVPFVITPHYCGETAEAVDNSAKIAGYPTMALTDQQAVLVDGARTEIIGAGEKIVFNSHLLTIDF